MSGNASGDTRPHRLEDQDTALSRRRHGFEPRWGHEEDGPVEQPGRARHPVKVEVAGSNPVRTARDVERVPWGEVAQLAEHAAENRGVGSSILPLATDPSGTRLEVQGRTSLANRAMQSEISVLFPALAMHRSNLVKTPVFRAAHVPRCALRAMAPARAIALQIMPAIA